MTYEYSTQGATLDFPNPYRIENQFLALRAAILIASALWLLWLARGLGGTIAGTGASTAAALGDGGVVALLIAGGVVLAAAGLLDGASMARQLRVFFGRGQPASLADEIARDRSGSSPAAQVIAETMRQGALRLAEPHGAINGLLYSIARHLITAPGPLRAFVQERFANLLAGLVLLVLFAVTLVVSRAVNAQALAAAVYVVLGALLIIRGYARGSQAVSLGPAALVALVVFAIVGTVFVGRLATRLPDLSPLHLPTIAWVLLGVSVLIEAIGLVAGFQHVDEPPPASTASEQTSISFDADPNLLVQEIDRELQRQWVEAIPNRRYLWSTPQIDANAQAGNFSGMILEETQPMPPQAVRKMNWPTVIAYPRFAWLAALDALGVVATAIGCLLWLTLAAKLTAAPVTGSTVNWSTLSIGMILLVSGGYAVRVAHILWGRLDFESSLIWIELQGSFARARVDLGNQWTDRVRSERSLVNVESMTLRAWVVRARSVLFDYRSAAIGSRVLVGMVGDRAAASAWVQQVGRFGQSQSMVVAPGAAEDLQRIARAQAINQAGSGSAGAARALDAAAAAFGGVTTTVTGAARPAQCTRCARPLAVGARFCSHCGKSLEEAAA